MRQTTALRTGLAALLIGGLLAAGSLSAQGQGGGMPPEIAAKIKAWQKWNEEHKSISNLQTLLYQVREMDKDTDTQLTKPQAAKVLPILKTWRVKPMMSDDQAKQVSKQMESVFNEKQIKKIATIQPPWKKAGGGGGRPGGGGGARPGGGKPGAPGGFTFPDPPKGGYNPINPDTLPFEAMRPQAKKGMDEFVGSLEKRAK